MNDEELTQLERFSALRDSGAITVEEFDKLKADLLQPLLPPPPPMAASPGATLGAARWDDDPFARFDDRYFDGTIWTDQVANGGHQLTDPFGRSWSSFPIIEGSSPFSEVAGLLFSVTGTAPHDLQVPITVAATRQAVYVASGADSRQEIPWEEIESLDRSARARVPWSARVSSRQVWTAGVIGGAVGTALAFGAVSHSSVLFWVLTPLVLAILMMSVVLLSTHNVKSCYVLRVGRRAPDPAVQILVRASGFSDLDRVLTYIYLSHEHLVHDKGGKPEIQQVPGLTSRQSAAKTAVAVLLSLAVAGGAGAGVWAVTRKSTDTSNEYHSTPTEADRYIPKTGGNLPGDGGYRMSEYNKIFSQISSLSSDARQKYCDEFISMPWSDFLDRWYLPKTNPDAAFDASADSCY